MPRDDQFDALIVDATENADAIAGADDAADALLTPEKLDAMRSTKRGAPRAVRQPEAPAEPDGGDDDDDAPPPPSHRPHAREKWLKRDWQAHAERMEQEAEEARRALEDAARVREESATSGEGLRESQQLVAFVALYGFGVMAAARGPHWAIDQTRAEAIGDPGGKLLSMFGADLPPWFPPAVALSVTLGGTIVEKMAEDKRIRALQQDPEK